MPDDPAVSPDSPPPRTTGGHFRWEPPSAAELQALMPGYTIEKLLGRGGMGAVYKGVQTNLDRTVAIKILPPGVEQEDPSFVDRFKNEARLMAKLMNPAVVGVFDFGTTQGGQLYIAMEYVDGTDVAQMIASQKKLPPDYALAITAHVCDALTAAHELGIVHRDIKPANILINMKGQVKVADFGLAKIEDPGSHGLTKTGYAMGTPDFVAPEAMALGTQVDGRADLYAVGVMLYQMLTGQIPRGAWQPASVLSPGTDARFDQIILKAMQYDREQRYQSSTELRRALDVILTVPLVRQDAPSAAAIPVSQVAQVPSPRTAAQKPVGKSPQQPKGGAETPVRNSTPGTPLPTKKSSAGMIYGIAAAIAVIAVLIFMFAGGGKKPETAEATAPKPSSDSKTVASSSTTAKSPAVAALPPGTIKLWDAPDKITPSAKLRWENSAVRLDGQPLAAKVSLRDVTIHTTILLHPDAGSPQIHARVRQGGDKASYYSFGLAADRKSLVLAVTIAGKGTPLKSWPLPVALGPNQWLRLGLGLNRNQLTASADGKMLGTLQDSTVPGAGDVVIFAHTAGYFRDTAYLPLDEPKAATPSAVAATPRFSPSTEPWVDALADPTSLKLSGTGKLTNQGLEFSGGVSRALFTKLAGPDYAVRVIVQVPDDGKAGAYLYLRHGSQGYYVRLRGTEHDLAIGRYAGKFEDFKKFAVERTLKAGEMFELEARIVGNKITAKFDGVTLGSVEDDSLRDGPLTIDSGHLFRAVQYLDLTTSTKAASSKSSAPTAIAAVAPPAMPKSAAPPSAPRPDGLKSATTLPPELAALDDQFKKLTAERVTAPFDAEVAKLNTGYLGGLDRKIAEEKTAGHLDGVLALDAEKKRVADRQPMPNAEDDATSTTTPAALKALRQIYRDAHAKIAAVRTASLKALTDPLTLRLQQLEADLTKQDRIPDAQTVRGYREALGKSSPDLQVVTASPALGVTAPPQNEPTLSATLAIKDGFTNSLGMKFVPVKDTDALFCIHETRYKDYAAYAAEAQGVDGRWKDQSVYGFTPTEKNEEHPVMNVSWEAAQEFCDWLSKKEGRKYRLPTDREWSIAVGIGRDEKWEKDTTPATVKQVPNEYPWGTKWPPPPGSGNFNDESRQAKAPNSRDTQYIEGYDDGFPTTAPVMSFKPNKLGLYDMGGNVSEWCEDWINSTQKNRVLRGGSWGGSAISGHLQSSYRYPASGGSVLYGFRVVVDLTAPSSKPPGGPGPPPPRPPPPPPTTGSPPKSDFTNTLGMQFVPVPDTKVMFCIHETRYRDYAAYAVEAPGADGRWKNQSESGFVPAERAEDHPVSKVSWEDAQKFCAWLGKKEGKTYRLPTDQEWSIAVGIGRDEKWTKDTTPRLLNGKVPNEYPWGDQWPPPKGSGNFSDQSRKGQAPTTMNNKYFDDYDDGFPTTAPVMSFKPNKRGLHDMDGNVLEWCEDWYDNTQQERVLRGGAWFISDRGFLLSSRRQSLKPDVRTFVNYGNGFRIVVEMAAP